MAQLMMRHGGENVVVRDVPAAVEDTTPERLFERRWALSLIEHVMARLRADYSALGKAEQYREMLRAEIAETVSTPKEVDDEIRFLMSVL